jgi:Rad3-related DNA helicase
LAGEQPALLSQRRVVISTGTRNLQDQLYDKDVPDLVRAMGFKCLDNLDAIFAGRPPPDRLV